MWTVARAFAPGRLAITADDLSRIDATSAAIAVLNQGEFQAIDVAATRAHLDRVMAASPANIERFAVARADVFARGEDAFGNLLLLQLGETVDVTWIGSVGAWLLVEGVPVSVARRHSLREEGGSATPDVPTRGLGGVIADPESAIWTPPRGARVVCASWTIARLANDLVARLASGETPERAAQRLVDTAIRREPDWPAVAIVGDCQ